VAGDFPGCHAAGVHRENLVVEAFELTPMFGNDCWLEFAFPIARNIDFQRPLVGTQGFFVVPFRLFDVSFSV
jgi:hypothetical protein